MTDYCQNCYDAVTGTLGGEPLTQKELNTAFISNAKFGLYTCLRAMLLAGADVNAVDHNRDTALAVACESHFPPRKPDINICYQECVGNLLAAGADANVNGNRIRISRLASHFSDRTILRLIEIGADMDTPDTTVLIYAVELTRN